MAYYLLIVQDKCQIYSYCERTTRALGRTFWLWAKLRLFHILIDLLSYLKICSIFSQMLFNTVAELKNPAPLCLHCSSIGLWGRETCYKWKWKLKPLHNLGNTKVNQKKKKMQQTQTAKTRSPQPGKLSCSKENPNEMWERNADTTAQSNKTKLSQFGPPRNRTRTPSRGRSCLWEIPPISEFQLL